MVEKLLGAKDSKGRLELWKLASEMHKFGKKMEDFTESKCAYSRSMDTCVLEMLYWTNQTRQIMSDARFCFDDCNLAEGKGVDVCKQKCVKNAREQYSEMQTMTE